MIITTTTKSLLFSFLYLFSFVSLSMMIYGILCCRLLETTTGGGTTFSCSTVTGDVVPGRGRWSWVLWQRWACWNKLVCCCCCCCWYNNTKSSFLRFFFFSSAVAKYVWDDRSIDQSINQAMPWMNERLWCETIVGWMGGWNRRRK